MQVQEKIKNLSLIRDDRRRKVGNKVGHQKKTNFGF